MQNTWQHAVAVLGVMGLVWLASSRLAQSQSTVTISLLAINDLHGNLEANAFRMLNPADRSTTTTVQAGGIETLASIVKDARARHPNTIVVGAGDLIGASPLISSLLADEPTIDALNGIGLAVSALGNHEFDKGYKELLRLQRGGCAEAFDPAKACRYGVYTGATFQYVAANVLHRDTGALLFPAYVVSTIGGVDVAFVGAVVKDTPTIVVPSGVAGLAFADEADAINAFIPELRARGIETIIVLIHQGGSATDPFDVVDCATLSGPIVDIVKRLDPAIDLVVSGHTHQGYQCRVDGRLVTQGDAFGHLVTQLDLTIDTRTKDVVTVTSRNIVVDPNAFAKDAAMSAILTKARRLTAPIATQPVASLAVEHISRDATPAGESALGDVIADAQLWATTAPTAGGAQIALMNPGGIRADLPPSGPNPSHTVSYGDIFTVQPFGNSLVVMTLTGAQLKAVLEQQFDNPAPGRQRILQISAGFTYTYNLKKAAGERVIDMQLHGKAVDPAAPYRIVVNSFLAEGGDRFTMLRNGTNRLGGALDLEAFQGYLRTLEQAGTPVGSGPRNRISMVP
jgi:5'-nucleotidase